MNCKRIITIALFDLQHSLFRLKGLVFLMPFFFFWYWVLKFLLEHGGESLVNPQSIALLSLVYKPEIAQILLILHPPTLSMFFIITLGTLPLFAMLSGNDQLASDCGHQTFRFFLTRATRFEIFAGRFISSYSLAAIAIIITAILTTLISLHSDPHSFTEISAYSLHVSALCLLYLLPLVAYMSAVSAMMSSGLSSLLMSMILYVILLILGSYIDARTGLSVSLVPGGVKNFLFDIKPHDLQFAIIMLLAYATIYAGFGWWVFKRRNI
ncbi:MAG TPA: hypothetical protein VJ981_06990 [Gammaproteobacteria bacterium]|nr:hypothetical protein [Gammaproteobacteria bacterium]